MILHKQGVIGPGLILGLAIAVISLFLFTSFTSDQTEALGRDLYSKAMLTCPGPDREGFVGVQLNDNNLGCPCDIDREDNPGYVDRYYVVTEKARTTVAKEIFDASFLNEFNEDKPLRISKSNLDEMINYIKDSIDTGISFSSPEMEFDYELNIHTSDQHSDGTVDPGLYTLCPSLKEDGKSRELCQREIFLNDWIEGGARAVPQCFTSDEECVKKIEATCSIIGG